MYFSFACRTLFSRLGAGEEGGREGEREEGGVGNGGRGCANSREIYTTRTF